MELTYINADGRSITLKQSRPYFLTKIDGTGNIRQTVNTFKAPDQDGAFYISSTLDMRNIILEGTVVANTPDEAYARRQLFLKIFSPKLNGTLVYRDRQIACVVEEAGFSVSTRQRIPNFFVSLLCPSPFFETLDEVREELASWIPLFEFELEIPESGMEFGMRQPSQIITVENIGDVSCGCEIVFQALGTVTNPELLSWGEKHSFALILFMFDAIRNDSKLVILDDPISSFDSNKKYAIINRLFKTGESGNSLYERTVLMLTHDFEPVIDYIQTNSGRQKPTSVCANYLENKHGLLQCTPIRKDDDLMSSVVLLKELASDIDIDIAARIGCLRKFIEHQYKEPQVESHAYNILSSLIHGRTKPSFDKDGNNELSAAQITAGTDYIKGFITDFDYDTVLAQCMPQCLMERYTTETSAYIKMLILRAYTERDAEARERLRRYNDVLRKYVDETYHIENDYIYSLDVRRFNIVPDNYIADAERYVANERARFDFATE